MIFNTILSQVWRLLLALALSVFISQASFAQNPAVTPLNLSAQVDDAMVHARVRDLKPSFALLTYKDQVLPLLGKYANDPSFGVHDALYLFARKGYSPQTMKVFSGLVSQSYEQAVDDLYGFYTPTEIQQLGGPELRQTLLNYLQKVDIGAGTPSSIKVLLLLAAFPPDPDVRRFLTGVHYYKLSYTKDVYYQGVIEKHQIEKQAQLHYSTLVDLALPVDLVLSEEGDEAATGRVIQSIKHGDVHGTLVFVMETTRFIRQKPVLREIVELVHDKRPTQLHYRVDIAPEPDSPVPIAAGLDALQDDTLRVCDLALSVLVENTGIDVGIPDLMAAVKKDRRTFPTRRYNDEELSRAYQVLKKGLSEN